MTRRKILALGIATMLVGLGTNATVANAETHSFSVQLNVAPPAVIYEETPAPRHGYVWAEGYWDYDHGHHIWRRGHWERERRGQRWHNGAWTERDGNWYLRRGYWERDHG